jgi:hypothetical protein
VSEQLTLEMPNALDMRRAATAVREPQAEPDEKRDRASDCQRVLLLLQRAKGDWVGDLYRKTGCMVHSRIADLRKRGHSIECKQFGRGDWRYRLISEVRNAK